MDSERTTRDIILNKEKLGQFSEYLERKSNGMVISFIDLCGSTELKKYPQREWLPKICQFLAIVTDIVDEQGGKVIKYIGDEVVSVFEDGSGGNKANRMESLVIECNTRLKNFEESFSAKFAFDYGANAQIDLGNFPIDYLGTPIDRCARIAGIVPKNGALASDKFLEQLMNRDSWRPVGDFSFKGIDSLTGVYQLKNFGEPLIIEDPDFYTKSRNELLSDFKNLKKRIEFLQEELSLHRTKSTS